MKFSWPVVALLFPLLLRFPTCEAQSSSGFVPITPCRVVDTRNPAGPLGGPLMSAGSTRSFPIGGSCGVPAGATGYSVNIGVLPLEPLSYLSAWPTGQSQPLVATLSSPGQALANAAIIPAGTNGAINLYVTNNTQVIIDINGYFAPQTTSSQSTAVGVGASTAASQNTAVGFDALQENSSGIANTAIGTGALPSNTSGNNNVGVGGAALSFNSIGSANTAIGTDALLNNLIGSDNTALGFAALFTNTTGANNVSLGAQSLNSNNVGGSNTAVGESSLYGNTDGSWNIAVGYQAGLDISTGSYNIDIGNTGASGDTNTIRIGTIGTQTSTFVAGISGTNIASGTQVLINTSGQLGVASSSERYKDDIHDMADASDGLMRLRPVTFRYKLTEQGGSRLIHYGLIGEEVDSVYPDLVVRGPKGEVESVQYHELPALLLNELQKQHKVIEEQERELQDANKALVDQRDAINSLTLQLKALTTQLDASKKATTNHRQ